MPLVILAWCIIAIMGVIIYGGCLLWAVQKNKQINKKKFFLCVMVACVIAWGGGVFHLFPQQGMPKLIDIELSVLQAGIALVLAFGVFKSINYCNQARLRILFTFLVFAPIVYWTAGEIRHVFYTKARFQCPATVDKKIPPSETAKYLVDALVTFEPDFWYRYFQYRRTCPK